MQARKAHGLSRPVLSLPCRPQVLKLTSQAALDMGPELQEALVASTRPEVGLQSSSAHLWCLFFKVFFVERQALRVLAGIGEAEVRHSGHRAHMCT